MSEPSAEDRARDRWERMNGRPGLIVAPGSAEERARERFEALHPRPPGPPLDAA